MWGDVHVTYRASVGRRPISWHEVMRKAVLADIPARNKPFDNNLRAQLLAPYLDAGPGPGQ